MVIWWVALSAVAIKASPVVKLDVLPAASIFTVVCAGQKSNGRQRTCLSFIQ
jgi:hypothetical protein